MITYSKSGFGLGLEVWWGRLSRDGREGGCGWRGGGGDWMSNWHTCTVGVE